MWLVVFFCCGLLVGWLLFCFLILKQLYIG